MPVCITLVQLWLRKSLSRNESGEGAATLIKYVRIDDWREEKEMSRMPNSEKYRYCTIQPLCM